MEKSIKNKEKRSFNPLNLFKRTDKQDSEILLALERISKQDFNSDFGSLYSTVNKNKNFFEKLDITPNDLHDIDDYADAAIFDTPESWSISEHRANIIEENYKKGIDDHLLENERHYLNSYISTLNYRKKYDVLINTLSDIATKFLATGCKPSQVSDKMFNDMNLSNNEGEQEPVLKNRDEFILKEEKTTGIIQDLKRLNISMEDIEKNNIIDELVNKGKTSSLVKASFSVGGTNVEYDARLSVKADEQGNKHLLIHPKRELNRELEKGFQGHIFSKEEKGNLLALGSAGKVIPIKNTDGTTEQYLIGTDSLTNELVAIRQKDVTIKDEFGGIKLSEKKKEALFEGEPVFLENINKGEMAISGLIQYSVEKGRLELLQYGLSISAIQNIKLQKEQQDLLQEGKTILIDGLFDSEGVKYNAWVRLDMKNRTLMQTKELPSKEVLSKKEIIPDNEHRTQVNQNTKGIKTEENKYSTKPIKAGRQQAETWEHKRNKNIKHN